MEYKAVYQIVQVKSVSTRQMHFKSPSRIHQSSLVYGKRAHIKVISCPRQNTGFHMQNVCFNKLPYYLNI